MANQRMAGEIWRTYDVTKIGNDGFDDADLNHLIKQKYANNDIFKIAAASGRVDASTDQRLRRLNSETVDYRSLPDNVKKQLFDRGILGNAVYLGGDPNDDKSYGPARENDDWRVQNSPNVGGSTKVVARPPQTQWVNNESTRNIPRGDRSEVLQWSGINADGSAVALRGTRVEEDRDGNKQLLKTRDTTWRVPDDYLPPRRSSSTSAAQPNESQAPRETPRLSERFDPSRYMLRTPVSATATSEEEPERQRRYGYTANGGGIELGGYERFIKNLPSSTV